MKLKPDKNQIRTHDLCNTGAVPYQLSYQAIWELPIFWVCNIPIEGEECEWLYKRSYIWTAEKSLNKTLLLLLSNNVTSSQLVWYLSQYSTVPVWHWEVMVQILFKPKFFFQALILSLFNCGDQLFLPILFFFRSFNIWYFIYSFAKQNIPVQFYLNVPILLFVKPTYSKEKQPSTLKH